MAYSKQNFKDGQTLTAEMLNKIEAGIIQNENSIKNIELTPGPQGPQGPQGEPGTPADLSGYLQYREQTLSDEEKTQARTNIGAASAEYIISVFEELKAHIQAGNTEAAIATLDNAILDMHVLA